MTIHVVNKYKHTPTNKDIYIGRGSELGNPYTHLSSAFSNVVSVATRDIACDKHMEYLKENKNEPKIREALNQIKLCLDLYGEINLVCFCAPQRCHGHNIKKLIEEEMNEIDPMSE